MTDSLTDPATAGAAPAPTEDRRALLKALLERRSASARGPGLTADPAARHEPFPLSDIQRAYWLGRDPALPLGGVGIHGYFEIDCVDLDLARLERAWNAVIARHDMMRCVVLADGRARILAQAPAYAIACDDLRRSDADRRSARLAELRARMAHQVFDPTQWPVFELRACRLDDRTTRLFVSEDAIHLDLASSEIVARDWLALYAGRPLDPPPRLSFRDVAVARDKADARDHAPSAEHDPPADLPDLPDPPTLPPPPTAKPEGPTFRRRRLHLDPDAWAAFKASAADHDLTPSDALLAVYADVLRAWNDSPRFLLNVTVQDRPGDHPELASITGDFTDFVLVDIDLSTPEPFAARAGRHRDALWHALETPDRRGVGALRRLGARQGGDGPVLAPFVYTSALGTAGYRALGALGTVVYEVTQTPQVLIDQQVLAAEDRLHLSWDSVDAAFADGVAAAMFEVLSDRLRALAADPAAWQDAAPPALPADQARRRAALNATDAPVSDDRLEARFAAIAAARPDAVAVIDTDGPVTFAALAARALGLAAALAPHLGPDPDAPVLVWLPKGRGQVVAVLAALLAGRPYLALDRAMPPDRLDTAIGLARTAVAVTDRTDAPPPAAVARLTQVDVASTGDRPTDAASGRSAIAYVLFTSGSTGAPKGVPIPHRAVVNRMDDVIGRFALTGADRVLGLTALHHDLSVFDLFGVLAGAGGAVVLPPDPGDGPGDPQAWARLIETAGVTLWNAVPAFLEMLLALPPRALAGRLDSLRHVFLSGDWVAPWLPERLAPLAPAARTHALGGPTETTVWDIACPDAGVPPGWTSIPYGRPLRNARYHVRHPDGADCPDWVAGELWIAGAGVSPGYLGGSLEDRARFLTDPATGERLYRSGDRGRIRDGRVEFLGRTDRMVKLRGQRVELGAVEAELRRLPGVGRAVAFTIDDNEGRPALVAAVAPTASDPALDPATDTGAATRLDLPPADSLGPIDIAARTSALTFSGTPLGRGALAGLLAALCEVDRPDGGVRRLHPSAGGRYAVQVTAVVRSTRLAGLAGGTYRLDPAARRLDRIGDLDRLPPSAHADRNKGLAEDAAATLVLSVALADLAPEYGDAARDLALLEAGYIGQLATTVAAKLGVAICPLGGLDAPADLALPDGHGVVHALLVGTPPGTAPSASQTAWPHEVERRLREAVSRSLPAAMRPAPLLLLSGLPLTSNGKPDIGALTALAMAGPEAPASAGVPATAPCGPAADRLHAALAAVIGSDAFPRDRGFQELGLFSVDLVRLQVKLAEAGFAVSVADLFNTPTVAALVDRLLGNGGADAATARGAVRRSRLARAGRRR